MTIIDLIVRHTGHSYRRKTASGEYAGPCPWCGGDDRFLIWADGNPRYNCLRGCGRKGDAIQFLRDYVHLPFAQAKEEAAAAGMVQRDPALYSSTSRPRLGPEGFSPTRVAAPAGEAPTGLWQEQARAFVCKCSTPLYGLEGARALAWLQGRGLSVDTLRWHCIGYNPADTYVDRETWGLPAEQDKYGHAKRVWLPRGVVIPWLLGDDVWGVSIRRAVKPGDKHKYYWVTGGTRGLYNANSVVAGLPAVIVEGELDALTIIQAAGDLAAVVATGSTYGARRVRWLARLGTAKPVLVAFDQNEPGEKAAAHWHDALPHAR